MQRTRGLDSLRGLAALAVALGHSNLVVTGLGPWAATVFDFPRMETGAIAARLAYLVLPSDAAVMLFFVLSGHVLWAAAARHPGGMLGGLPGWALARAFRIYPTVIATALPLAWLHGATPGETLRNMALLDTRLNGPTWSLQVEIVCSIALFVVHRAARGTTRGLLLALLLLVALHPVLRALPGLAESFMPMFLLGALIGAVPARLWRPALGVLGLALLLAASLVLGHGPPGRVAEAAGAFLLVGTVGRLDPAWLHRRWLLFLGAVSYPLYLAHAIGLAVAAPVVAAADPGGAAARVLLTALVSLAVTLPLAWLLHVAVEQPAMRARPRLATGRALPQSG